MDLWSILSKETIHGLHRFGHAIKQRVECYVLLYQSQKNFKYLILKTGGPTTTGLISKLLIDPSHLDGNKKVSMKSDTSMKAIRKVLCSLDIKPSSSSFMLPKMLEIQGLKPGETWQVGNWEPRGAILSQVINEAYASHRKFCSSHSDLLHLYNN